MTLFIKGRVARLSDRQRSNISIILTTIATVSSVLATLFLPPVLVVLTLVGAALVLAASFLVGGPQNAKSFRPFRGSRA